MRRSTGRSPWSRKTRRAPPEGTPVNERRAGPYPRAPSLAPLGQFTLSRPTGPAVAGANGRMISAPTEWAVTRRLRGAPRPFGGMAPTAARRARLVQRGNYQGLPGGRCGPPKARQRLSRNQKGTGRGCTPGSCFVCTAFRRHEPPYWGVQGGRSPPALLSPHFFGKKWGRPPRRHPPGGWASTRRADTIRPYGLGSWRTALVRPAPRGRARVRTKKRAARDTGGACVYRSSRKYAKPRLAGGCLSRLLRREVKISTTTVTT